MKISDYVYDSELDIYGVVKEIKDIHNIIIEYEEGGSGLYCLDPSCDEYDISLKIIKSE